MHISIFRPSVSSVKFWILTLMFLAFFPFSSSLKISVQAATAQLKVKVKSLSGGGRGFVSGEQKSFN